MKIMHVVPLEDGHDCSVDEVERVRLLDLQWPAEAISIGRDDRFVDRISFVSVVCELARVDSSRWVTEALSNSILSCEGRGWCKCSKRWARAAKTSVGLTK